MTRKSASRLARLVGVVVSPLITAPSAGAALERGALAPAARSEAPAMRRAHPVAAPATADVRGGRRVSF